MKILGLHGAMGCSPSRWVHDAGFCVLDGETGRLDALVEMEKLSGMRHDPALDVATLERGLDLGDDDQVEVACSHFSELGSRFAESMPLFTPPPGWDWSRIGPCSVEPLEILGRRVSCSRYLHELGHVFSGYLYRSMDSDRFLGLVVEGEGSFAQNALFLVDGRRVSLLRFNAPLLSGGFFQQFLAERVFDAGRDQLHLRHAAPGKIMALAAYGDSERFREPLLEAIQRFSPGDYVDYRRDFCPSLEAMNLSWKDRIDLCASGQRLFEELLEAEAIRIREEQGDLPLVYSGGCALSVKANSRLRRVFSEVVIPPNCGDDGQAAGLAAAHLYLSKGIAPPRLTSSQRLFPVSGGSFTGRLSPGALDRVVDWLLAGEVVAWVDGGPEIGPRALCSRSLLASPHSLDLRDVLNHIKQREYYRPVSPVVLDSQGDEVFQDYFTSPYMLYDMRLRRDQLDRLPAVVHRDGTARPQSVEDQDSNIGRLLRRFAERTGEAPLLCNTSLNSRGRPIAATREQVEAELSRLYVRHLVIGGEIHGS